MRKIEKFSLFIGFIALFISYPIFASADAGGFTKKVQHPENQITSGEPLNLMMKPGQKQKVNVVLENLGEKETTIEVKLSGARTNGSGGLEYGPNTFKKDKSMKYDLADLVKVPAEVKIPGKSKENLVLDITMPETSYDGVVTGGIQLMEKGKDMGKTEENGALVTNKFAFLFGVTLHMTDKEVKPDFDLRSAKAGLANYRNAVFLDIGSTQAFLAKGMTLNAEITEKGKKEVLYQKKSADVSIAPNSLLSFPVTMDGDRMKPGDFTANVVLKGYDKEWKWSKNFTITKEEADKFNQQDPYLVQERGLNWKMIALIVGGVILLVVIVVVILKVTKKKTPQKGKKAKKKSSKGK
ncbi:DUF916 and DUF3324 domain-containing protein [Vagococcus hydrophili]|uniref:DUF916 and DUF3324 domain-containing protein n=1 Tax=Vagococcus hydrophili TaxID=2714947 RepID=A0A6G8AT98_9ENTE|nr:DUF916 and DUF3324 domain-containing protein [Vagococcus hydrophili]QIL48217.1 DUF916 and DUF3324 domain-containing protein [Vagococcus hydrophili]